MKYLISTYGSLNSDQVHL